MIIRESISFERGKDPKDSMNVGVKSNAIRIKDVGRWSSKLNDKMPMTYKQAIEFLEWPHRGKRSTVIFVEIIGDEDFGYHTNRLDRILRTGRPLIYGDKIFVPDEGEHGLTGHYTPYDLNESVNFERGNDPKRSMGIGAEIYDADGMGFDREDGSFSFTEQETKDLLSNPYLWNEEPFKVLLLTKLLPTGGSQRYSLSYLIGDSSPYDYIRYKGEHYPIPGKNNELSESVNFERGKDPREAIGIGDKEEQVIKKIESIILSRKFKRTPIDIESEAFIHDIAQWKNPKGISVNLYSSLDENPSWEYGVSIMDNGRKNTLGEINDDDIGEEWIWENILSGRPSHYTGIKESISFERGKDPKDKMKLGEWQKRIIEIGLTDVAVSFNEPWLKEIIPEYAKKIMDTGMIINEIRPYVYEYSDGSTEEMVLIDGDYPNGNPYRTNIQGSKLKEPDLIGEINTGSNVLFPIMDEIEWQRTVNRHYYE